MEFQSPDTPPLRSKLTYAEKMEIRRRWDRRVTRKSLAAEYNVRPSLIESTVSKRDKRKANLKYKAKKRKLAI